MKYSVIIPVYNAEKTLSACLSSILGQNYLDAEIILVNDGSSDRSSEICGEFAEKYQKIKYISQTNGGVSAARNTGLEHAVGEYILFVDSDDTVTDQYFEQLDILLEENDYDFIQFSYIVDNNRHRRRKVLKNKIAYNQDDTSKLLSEAIFKKTLNSPWNKLYKREFLERYSIRFNNFLSIGEDKVFNFEYLPYIKLCRMSSQILYTVNTASSDSLSRKKRTDLQEQSELSAKLLYEAINNSDLPESCKIQYRIALDFLKIRSVYAEAKLLRKNKVAYRTRMKVLSDLCDRINACQYKIPHSFFCYMINTTVKWKLLPLIDVVAWKLLR